MQEGFPSSQAEVQPGFAVLVEVELAVSPGCREPGLVRGSHAGDAAPACLLKAKIQVKLSLCN